MALTLDDLYASPDHYLHSFDGDTAVFVAMDRAAYHRSIFLDARIDPAGGTLRLPLTELLRKAPPPPAPTAWIFHVAHCGSTLLARALDEPSANLVLREPLALRQQALAPDPRLAIVRAMLGKRYAPGLPTVIKANVPVNFILPQLLDAADRPRALFLYLGLRDYLLAILRDERHRGWLRAVTGQLAAHLPPLADASDAVRAAALWLAQMTAYRAALKGPAEARSLDAEVLFAEPRAVLLSAAAHLAVPLDEAAIAGRVAGPLFATYSKDPTQPFDNAARIERRRGLERALAPEFAEAAAWVTDAGADPAAALPRPLL